MQSQGGRLRKVVAYERHTKGGSSFESYELKSDFMNSTKKCTICNQEDSILPGRVGEYLFPSLEPPSYLEPPTYLCFRRK